MSETKTLDLEKTIDVAHLWKGIIDSYHNYYDVFSELVQNSVDSVRKTENENRSIDVTFDLDSQTVIVRDNGIGLSEDELTLFALGNTNKSTEESSIGEKGLGASFILGISDEFRLETVKGNKRIIATSVGAYAAIRNGNVPQLTYEVEDVLSDSYCEIQVKITSIDINITSIDFFKFLLRTRTAIGNTKNLFLSPEEREEISVTATFIAGGDSTSETIPFLYLHLDELVAGTYPIFDAVFVPKSNRWIVDEGEIQKKPKGILRLVDYDRRIYVAFAEVEIFSRVGEMIGESRFPEDVIVSIKGCPTSVQVNKPRLGDSGYYTNLHVVTEGDSFTLDAGRKTITRENADEVRAKIKSFFTDIIKYAKFFIGTPHDAIGEGAGLDQIKDRARETEDLKISEIPFLKVPRHEQSVVAIFHELLAAKVINGYGTLLVSQYNTFDILFQYETEIGRIGKNPLATYQKSAGKNAKTFKHVSFGEFKFRVAKFCEEVNNDIKRLDHVNLLIAWEVGAVPAGWEFRKIYPDEVIYDGAKYILTKTGHKNIHVMLLKDFEKAEE